jgi:hypothetical protein
VSDKTYTLRVDNTSGIRLGVYMAPRRTATHPKRLGTAEAYNEEHRPDGAREHVLTGWVTAAERT